MSSPDSPHLTSPEGLSAYLDSRSIQHTPPILLTGGTANYVYRTTLLSSSPKTVIYKHAAPYLHSNTNFPFDPTRMDYEDRALEIIPPLLQQQLKDSWVHAVGWYNYDRERKLLCIEDGGTRNLKEAYADPELDIPRIGEQIGKWLAALHMCSKKTSLSLTEGNVLSANNAVGVAIYRYAYANLSRALAEYGHDAEFGEFIDKEYGSRLATENECVCHGDFWPGNVLLRFRNEEDTGVDLTVVDWEMTRRGTSATDVGQFAAEAFLLDRFRGGRGLLPAFLNAYLTAREEDTADGIHILEKEWLQRVAVHWGVHVAFWPTGVEWTDGKGTQKLVDIGVGVLRAAVKGDWDVLRSSELFNAIERTRTASLIGK